MKASIKKRIAAFVISVLLAAGISPAAYAARLPSANINIEKKSVSVAVGGTVTLSVDYSELESINDSRVDVFKARVSVDKYKVAEASFGSDGDDLTTIVITGLTDGVANVYVDVYRYSGFVKVTVGRGEKSEAQIKKEEEAKKAEEAILKNDTSALGAALAEAIKKSTKKEVMITTNSTKDPAIPVNTLKALAARASQAGKYALLRIDSPGPDGKTQSRLYVDPSGLTSLKSDFKTGITVDRSRASLGSNYIASVKCGYTGKFGLSAEIAVKVSGLPKNVDNIAVYNVDSSGKLYKIAVPACSVDSNGFLSFFTKLGGEIVLMKSTEKASAAIET